ncbi:MAG: hypothetical protein ACAI38_05430 [Myxococcota bacterium]
MTRRYARPTIGAAFWASILVAAGCSTERVDEGERKRERPAPQIITSAPPPKVEPKAVPVVPDQPMPARLPDTSRLAEPKERGLFDYPEGYDAEYDVDDAHRADAAFDTVMGKALDPFAPDPDDPPAAAEPKKDDAKAAVDNRPRQRLSCRPRYALHKSANEDSGAVARLPVGTRLKLVKRGQPGLAGNGDVSDWLHVEAEGKKGWILESATHEVASGQEGLGYLRCCGVAREAEDEASGTRERFLERVDYVACLTKALAESGSSRDAAELVLARAIALGRAAEMVERSDKLGEPYKGFMQRYGGQLDWDPDGYAVRAGDMWAAEEKYRGEPAAEALAWTAAAYSAVPKICGREIACAVARSRAYWGEYLARYPNGVHAQEAMDAIAELRPRGETDERLELDRNAERVEQCLATIDSLTRIVASSSSVGRVQALGTLEGLRRFVLAKSGHVQTKR